jgi:hypothetical protein
MIVNGDLIRPGSGPFVLGNFGYSSGIYYFLDILIYFHTLGLNYLVTQNIFSSGMSNKFMLVPIVFTVLTSQAVILYKFLNPKIF